MGCISSKIMTRSRSFQEELNQSLHRTANGFPVLEELLVSRNGGDHFIALVCTANTVSKELRTGSFTLESNNNTDIKPSFEAMNPETINTWELMEGFEEDEEEEQQSSPSLERFIYLGKRSMSFHWTPEYALPPEARFSGTEERESSGDGRGILRSRSFHTIEEYDAMVERNWLPKAQDTKFEDFVANTEMQLMDGCEPSSTMCCDVKQSNIEVDDGKGKPCLGKEDIVQEKSVIEEAGAIVVYKPSSNQENETTNVPMSSTTSSYAIKSMDVVGDVAVEGNAMNEKGLRRKAMAKGLATLRIPCIIDFPAIGSLKEWLEVGGQAFTPGGYVTPRFGSFSLPIQMNGNEAYEGWVFDPEMVTAFEAAMQQLQAEEERIVTQIIENLEEGGIEEKEADEDISVHIKKTIGDLAAILE